MDRALARLVALVGDGPAVSAVADDLRARYAEPQRRYHTAEHLAEMTDALDVLTDAVQPAVTCAVLWHDAVYDPRAADNEERSAELAARQLASLAAPPELVAETVRLVRLTAAHDPQPTDLAGCLLCDADLAILASSPERYARYAAAVREEYGHVDAAAFRAGRSAVLHDLTTAPWIYATEAGRRRWETPARQNIARELQALGG